MAATSLRDVLAEPMRETLFGGPIGGGPARIGAEVELIPVDARSRGVIPVDATLLPLLRSYATSNGWRQRESSKGAPRFGLPGGGSVTLEPGGQIEYATPPYPSPRELIDNLDAVLAPLHAAAAAEGICLLATGVDPHNPIDQVPLQIESERYRAMDAYFATIGPAGAVMMRQTASIQVNVDAASDPVAVWRVLNAAAPHLTAIFANSPRYAGQPTGHASYRAKMWRLLDPSRTGLFPCRTDPAAEYAAFALNAPVISQPASRSEYLPLAHWLETGMAGQDLVHEHLSTLFPEVRPKGWFEVRSIDAVPLEWLAAPIVLVGAIALDDAALAESAQILGPPDSGLLACAGSFALQDTRIAQSAARLVDVAMRTCARRGTAFCSAEQRRRAEVYFERYTRRGRSLSDDVGK
jgi:glutamate--cysteine ligase